MKKEKLLENKKFLGIIGVTIILAFLGGMYLKEGKEDRLGQSIFTDGKDIEKIELKDNKVESEKKKDIKKTTEEVVIESGEIVVDIKGEVKNPGVYKLENGSIIEDLIEMAGGITKDGTLQNINRAQVLKPNEAIVIDNKENMGKKDELESNNSLNEVKKEEDKKGSLININTASAEELKTLNGIGEAKAEAIITYREEKGAFKSIEEIQNVSGIGKASFEKMKDKICI